MVVDEDESEGPALFAIDHNGGSVEAIRLPQVVGQFSFKSPHVLPHYNGFVESMSFEEPINALCRGREIGGEETFSVLPHGEAQAGRQP